LEKALLAVAKARMIVKLFMIESTKSNSGSNSMQEHQIKSNCSPSEKTERLNRMASSVGEGISSPNYELTLDLLNIYLWNLSSRWL
jgi:hypothetical protein